MGAVSATPGDPGGVPAWKQRLNEQKKLQAEVGDMDAKFDGEDDAYAGLPDWKRRVLIEKAKKQAEKDAPRLEAERKERERQQKLADMPTWKRNLHLAQ